MFRRRVHFLHIAGISVGADVSSVLVLLLVVWSLGNRPGWLPDLPSAMRWGTALMGALLLFLSIVIHELGHAFAARAVGTEVERVTLFLFGGVAELRSEPLRPWRDAITTGAGPAATGLLVLILWLVTRASVAVTGDIGAAAFTLLQYLLTINTLLALFNLAPAFPLDGGRLLRAVLWQSKGDYRWATVVAARVGTILAAGLILFGILVVLRFGQTLAAPELGIRLSGLWYALIGTFLLRSSLQIAQAYRASPSLGSPESSNAPS